VTTVYTNKDYLSFYPREIDAHVKQLPNGTLVPLHNWGGPLLWTVPFTLWGRAGAAAVIVVISVLTVVNVYYLQRELGITKAYASLVSVLFVIGTPLYMYSSMQFVEPIGALVVIFAARTLINPAPSALRVTLTSAAAGYLPWVHGRFIPFAVIIGALLIARVVAGPDRRNLRAYVPAVVPMAVFILGIELFYFTVYGTLNPSPGNAANGDGIFQISPVTGLSSMFLDRQSGLFPHFPLLLLAIPGFLLALRRGMLPTHLMLLGVVGPYVLAVSTFWAWWAGFSPPARFLASVTPVLAYYVAVTLQRMNNWTVTALAVLAAATGFAISLFGDLKPLIRLTESGGPGTNLVLDHLGEKLHLGQLSYLFLTHRVPGVDSFMGFGNWTILIAVAAALVWFVARNRPASRTPLEPLVGLFPAVRSVVVSPRQTKPTDD
jgi:hypothetical protein